MQRQKYTSEPCRLYAINLCVVYEDTLCNEKPGDPAVPKAAYERGDYLKAMSEFWPLAQAGNPKPSFTWRQAIGEPEAQYIGWVNGIGSVSTWTTI